MSSVIKKYHKHIVKKLISDTIIDQYVKDGSETYSTRGSFDGNLDGAYIKMPYYTPLDWYRLDRGIPQPLYHNNVVDKGFTELIAEKYGAREEDIWPVWDLYRETILYILGINDD